MIQAAEEAVEYAKTTIAASNDSKSLQTHVEVMIDLQAIIKNTYCKDMIYAKIIAQPDAHPRFGIWEGLIWTKNQLKHDVICILQDAFQIGRRLIEIIIDHAHQTIGIMANGKHQIIFDIHVGGHLWPPT